MNPKYAFIAACMAHVEGYYSIKSLAFKNHNPGNIEHADGKFWVYESALQGFEASVADIAANAGKTLRQFIYKYAPPNENDSAMYCNTVSTLTGIGLDEVI